MCCFLAENKSFLQFSKSWPFPAKKEFVCEKPALEKKNGIHLVEKIVLLCVPSQSYFFIKHKGEIIRAKESKTLTKA